LAPDDSWNFSKACSLMFPIESFRKTLLKIVEILQRLEIPFHLTGGVTSVAYGEPRLTQDIDIVLQNESTRKQLAQLLSALKQSDFIFDSSAIETRSSSGLCRSRIR
jgi:hypothetical protein